MLQGEADGIQLIQYCTLQTKRIDWEVQLSDESGLATTIVGKGKEQARSLLVAKLFGKVDKGQVLQSMAALDCYDYCTQSSPGIRSHLNQRIHTTVYCIGLVRHGRKESVFSR